MVREFGRSNPHYDVVGYYFEDGRKMPMEGRLFYRGIDVRDIVKGFQADDRFGFEETAYLLLFGQLPNTHQLEKFKEL